MLILDGAMALIERDGPGALSMRRLGSALGVEGMAIYHHFDSRDDLLDAIGDRLLEPLHELELGDDWREACRRFATALRDVAVAQPATFQLLGLQPFDTPASLATRGTASRRARRAGFSSCARRWRSTARRSATPAATRWRRRPASRSTPPRPPAGDCWPHCPARTFRSWVAGRRNSRVSVPTPPTRSDWARCSRALPTRNPGSDPPGAIERPGGPLLT